MCWIVIDFFAAEFADDTKSARVDHGTEVGPVHLQNSITLHTSYSVINKCQRYCTITMY